MFGLAFTVVILLVAGYAIAVYVDLLSGFKEIGILLGIDRGIGVVSMLHLGGWLIAVFWVGPPESDWVFAGMALPFLAGTIAASFYLANRNLVRTIRRFDRPFTPSNPKTKGTDVVPVSGTVTLETAGNDASDDGSADSFRAPFTGVECAAHEWAVKRRRRWSRYRTYSTIDCGEAIDSFRIETEQGLVDVEPNSPTLLLVAEAGVLGYERSMDTPGDVEDTMDESGPMSSLTGSRMRYYESTLEPGSEVTVIGSVGRAENLDGQPPRVDPIPGESLIIIDFGFDALKRLDTRYFRWFPHIAIIGTLIGWGAVLGGLW